MQDINRLKRWMQYNSINFLCGMALLTKLLGMTAVIYKTNFVKLSLRLTAEGRYSLYIYIYIYTHAALSREPEIRRFY